MAEIELIPEQTVQANGTGPEIDVPASSRKFLLTLRITRQIEQESLDIGIHGSADKTTWSAKPIVAFPQKFYAGEYQILLDISEHADVKYLRGAWTLARWGRGRPAPRFTFSVTMRDLSGEAAAA